MIEAQAWVEISSSWATAFGVVGVAWAVAYLFKSRG